MNSDHDIEYNVYIAKTSIVTDWLTIRKTKERHNNTVMVLDIDAIRAISFKEKTSMLFALMIMTMMTKIMVTV